MIVFKDAVKVDLEEMQAYAQNAPSVFVCLPWTICMISIFKPSAFYERLDKGKQVKSWLQPT